MVAVPVMKLFSLTVKTVAKPVAKRMKSGICAEASHHLNIRRIIRII